MTKTTLTSIPWTLQRTAAPSALMTTQLVKDHIRETLSDAANDTLIDTFARAAEDALEGELCRAFLTQTWVLRLDCFPAWEIRLPRPPLVSVTSISYLEAVNGAPTTLATDQYVVDTAPEPGRIYEAYGMSWPATRAIPNAVTITYVVGAANAAAVPAALRIAVCLLAAEMYENRERGQAEVLSMWRENPTHERLIGKYRLPTEFIYR